MPYRYSNNDSALQMRNETRARRPSWLGTDLNPRLASQELCSLTTTSTDKPIKTGGARSKILLRIEQVVAVTISFR